MTDTADEYINHEAVDRLFLALAFIDQHLSGHPGISNLGVVDHVEDVLSSLEAAYNAAMSKHLENEPL